MYAIAIRLIDIDEHQHKQVQEEIIDWGFRRVTNHLYFGNDDMNAVECVLLTQYLDTTYEWFRGSIGTLRMLRIEEEVCLTEAIENFYGA